MKYSIIILLFGLMIMACKGDKSANYPSQDLLKHGFAISVKAPANAEIKSDDFGIMKELTIKGDDNYYVQILKGTATTSDMVKAKSDQINLVKGNQYFSKIIEEYEDGFIFEKVLGERTNYDFRFVKLQGEDEYIYQTGMIGDFSEEDVRMMYKSIK